jgi:hypothetical protein
MHILVEGIYGLSCFLFLRASIVTNSTHGLAGRICEWLFIYSFKLIRRKWAVILGKWRKFGREAQLGGAVELGRDWGPEGTKVAGANLTNVLRHCVIVFKSNAFIFIGFSILDGWFMKVKFFSMLFCTKRFHK